MMLLVKRFMCSFRILIDNDDLTEEEESRVAEAVNGFIGGLIQRGQSPNWEDINLFAKSARRVARSGRRAPTPQPEETKGIFF